MNRRNADFIFLYNRRDHYPLVDDKRVTKQLAQIAGIAVPELYGVIEIEHQIQELEAMLAPYSEFVIKPAHGSGGEGIWVVTGVSHGRYRLASGASVGIDELGYHLSSILSGMYSLAGRPDCALIEYRVNFDPIFDEVSYQGGPDIRTVVFRGVPVMAMLRLPTRDSHGKANLHQGAIGVGVDIGTGATFSGVWREVPIENHPDTGGAIANLQIPHWDDILAMTARCQDLAGLGYLGVDVVIDRDRGPLMLEMNARPGLSIQMANKMGLLPRLDQLKRLREIPTSVDERLAMAKALARGDPIV
jgi:alpha-L-glutamate ligase-like protein